MTSGRNVEAFTLIEILITIVILSIGIVAILHAFETSMSSLTQAREVLFSTILCRDKLSDIRSDVVVGKAPDGTSAGAFEGEFKDYRWSMDSILVPRNVKNNSARGGSAKDKDDVVEVDLYKLKVSVWRNGYPDDQQESVTYLRL